MWLGGGRWKATETWLPLRQANPERDFWAQNTWIFVKVKEGEISPDGHASLQ